MVNKLNEYNGTILFISHDRYFIDKLARQTFEIDNEQITKCLGNYTDLKNQKQRFLERSEQLSGRKKQ